MGDMAQKQASLANLHFKKVLLIAILTLTVLGSLILVGLFIIESSTQNPLVSEFITAQQAADFPLFVPKNLPDGYTYRIGSLHVSNDVAVFSINGPGNRTLAVTEQAKPKGYDFSKLSGTVEFTSSLGKNYIEDFEIRTTGSIVGDKVWLIINTDNPVGSEDMNAILLGFREMTS